MSVGKKRRGRGGGVIEPNGRRRAREKLGQTSTISSGHFFHSFKGREWQKLNGIVRKRIKKSRSRC